MLIAACRILKNMHENNIFSELELMNQEHKVVVTGHSLGAGIAVVLGFLIRREESFEDRVYVYAYGIPGGLLNESAQTESKKFVIAVIHNDDIIPRLSLKSMFKLRNELRVTLYNCDKPKYKVVCWGVGHAMLSCLLCCCESARRKVLLKKFISHNYLCLCNYITLISLATYVAYRFLYFYSISMLRKRKNENRQWYTK